MINRISINLLVVYRESVNLIGYITRRLSADSLRQDSCSRDYIRDPLSNLNQPSPQCRWLTIILNVVVPPLKTKRSHIYLTKSDGIQCASEEQEKKNVALRIPGNF